MLNPVWLNTFKTLIEVGHFTRTAETLHMTQPGVTQHINKLENACGYPLIKRFNKQFELTLYGKKVYHYALDYFANEAKLLQNLGQDEAFKGRCSIGCSGTLAWLLYSPLLDLQARHLGLSIELEATPNERIFEQVKQGTIDIGLVTKKPEPKYFSSQKIGAEHLALVMPACTKIDSSLNCLLKDLGVIRHPDFAHYFQTFIAQCEHSQLSQLDLEDIKIQSYINQIHQILEPITRGIGFTVVPSWCVDLFYGKDKLKVLETKKDVLEPVYLVSKLNTSLGKRYHQVISVIEKTLNTSK